MPKFFKKNKRGEDTEKDWLEESDYEEGQLSIDVYETEKNIIIKSTIAGVKPEDLDISINNDMLTIRGERKNDQEVREEDYLYRECFWGYFSRSIILPTEVNTKNIDAVLENGILTVTLEKLEDPNDVSVRVK